MKEVKITITGDVLGFDYCSQSLYNDEDDFFSRYYCTYGWEKITGLYVDLPNETYDFENYENLVKKKGKYVKTVEYFHDLFKEDGEHPLPVDVHTRVFYEQSADYIIKLEDDEEFDIKKLQLIKSDYEIEICPYFILAEKILYDGKEVMSWDFDDYDVESKMYTEFVVDGYVNGPDE